LARQNNREKPKKGKAFHEANRSLSQPITISQELSPGPDYSNQAGWKVELCVPAHGLWIETEDQK